MRLQIFILLDRVEVRETATDLRDFWSHQSNGLNVTL